MERNYFQCSEPVPLTDGHFKDIAFNGAQFLLLDVVNSEIYRYDTRFCLIETISLKGKYTSICYDGDEHCYWALVNNSASCLYRLDESLNEIGRIRMRNAPQWNANNICYDWCSKTLWISFQNRIAFTDKRCGEYTFLRNDCEGRMIRCLLVLPRCRLFALSSGQRESLYMVRPDCEERMIMNIPEEYRVSGMCAVKPKESCNCKKYKIYILLTHTCSHQSFVMCCTVCCCGDICADECDYSCEGELCEIIHSIALAEVGISHILNAEGEKIQKAVASSSNIKELLEVNESVKNTITHIIQLENQLTIKLDTAMRHTSCKKDPSCCKKDPCGCQKS